MFRKKIGKAAVDGVLRPCPYSSPIQSSSASTRKRSRGHRRHFRRLSFSRRPTADDGPPRPARRREESNKKAPHRPPTTLELTRTAPLLRDSSPALRTAPHKPPRRCIAAAAPPGRCASSHGAAAAGGDRHLRQHHGRRRGRRHPRARGEDACPPLPSLPFPVSTHWWYGTGFFWGFVARGFGLGFGFGSARRGFVRWRVRGRGGLGVAV